MAGGAQAKMSTWFSKPNQSLISSHCLQQSLRKMDNHRQMPSWKQRARRERETASRTPCGGLLGLYGPCSSLPRDKMDIRIGTIRGQLAFPPILCGLHWPAAFRRCLFCVFGLPPVSRTLVGLVHGVVPAGRDFLPPLVLLYFSSLRVGPQIAGKVPP